MHLNYLQVTRAHSIASRRRSFFIRCFDLLVFIIFFLFYTTFYEIGPSNMEFSDAFNCTSTKTVGICSPRFLKPTRHVAVICEISETIRSSSCTVEKPWILADQYAILVVHLFSLFSFEFKHDVDFSFLHCRHVDFVTTSCCFQALRILR